MGTNTKYEMKQKLKQTHAKTNSRKQRKTISRFKKWDTLLIHILLVLSDRQYANIESGMADSIVSLLWTKQYILITVFMLQTGACGNSGSKQRQTQGQKANEEIKTNPNQGFHKQAFLFAMRSVFDSKTSRRG